MRYSFPRAFFAATLIALLATQSAWGWGRDGHRMINRLAAQYLSADVPAFLRSPNALDTMEYLGPEPDRWKGKSEPQLANTSSPDHYIDMEWADLVRVPCSPGNAGCGDDRLTLPRLRYDFVRQVDVATAAHPELHLTAEKIGMQPWAVEETWQKLKADMREYRNLAAAHQPVGPAEAAVLYDAGILGHYVADGSQPLHTTIQFNGWTGPNPNHYTTEHHIHAQFESVYVSANIKYSDVSPLVAAAKPHVIDDEWNSYLTYLRHTNSFVEKTYQLEKSGGFTDSGTPEAKAFTEERLAAGAIELRDLIDSAWVHSGDPVEAYKGPQ